MDILDGVDGPKNFVEKLGARQATLELLKRAERIARDTRLDTDSWDDPEDWQLEAAELAHGFIALIKYGNPKS
jgi:hypothetical protein